MKTAGILLAGGQSRRFGSPKAFARYNDELFYEMMLRLLRRVSEQVVIVTRQEFVSSYPPHLHVITDAETVADQGPLAGIYTAMSAVEAERYFVLPCDMPLLTEEVIHAFAQKCTPKLVNAVKAGERAHPLVSCWSYEMRTRIEDALLQGQNRVMKLLDTIEVEWLQAESLPGDATNMFQNINTQEQWEEVRQL